MVIELVSELDDRIRKLIYAVCEAVLPEVEKDFGFELRGLELASILLSSNIGEGYNCSLFNILASKLNDDSINEDWWEFCREIERFAIATDFRTAIGSENPPSIALGYVFGFLPYEYR